MFGVSSPLWDYVFGTIPSKEKKRDIAVNVGADAERWL